MTVQFPPRLNLARLPTPLQPLDRLSEIYSGPRIWVKRDDLTDCSMSGNKIRKLEFCLAQAIEQGCDTIITVGGVQSNHCRTTALLCAQLGLKCHLVLRGESASIPDGNLLLDLLAGAEIAYYPNHEYQAREVEILTQWKLHYEDQGACVYTIPVGASDGIGLWGYINAALELASDFEAQSVSPTHIISATGSGGTQGGLTVGNQLFELGAKVIGINVCDDENYFLNKVAEDIADWKSRYTHLQDVKNFQLKDDAINVLDGYVGPGYARATSAVFDTIKTVAAKEGLVLDPVYSGKAFHGLIDKIQAGYFDGSSDIVFVHTGGIFGLFPQRSQISF